MENMQWKKAQWYESQWMNSEHIKQNKNWTQKHQSKMERMIQGRTIGKQNQ